VGFDVFNGLIEVLSGGRVVLRLIMPLYIEVRYSYNKRDDRMKKSHLHRSSSMEVLPSVCLGIYDNETISIVGKISPGNDPAIDLIFGEDHISRTPNIVEVTFGI
jgi:hypothetical protein